MPLFQPSNITPSAFAGVGNGTVAVADIVKITWQVNGNEPMTGYKIELFDTSNNEIYVGNIITLSAPFYPTDEKGNLRYFSHNPSDTWSSLGLSDGNDYILKITQYWGNNSNYSITQISPSIFKTRTAPTLAISKSNGDSEFLTLDTVTQDFTANYAQEQGDNIEWVRWRLYQDDDLIDDTGIVNTQMLSYQADNLISGNSYKLACTIQTENGVQCESVKTFSVSYDFKKIEGQFELNCLDKASNLLSWDNLNMPTQDSIPGESNDNEYSFDNDKLVLPKDSTIVWNTKNGEALNIPTDYTAVINTRLSIMSDLKGGYIKKNYQFMEKYSHIDFSYDGTLLAMANTYASNKSTELVDIYDVYENNADSPIVYKSTIACEELKLSDGEAAFVTTVKFSPNNNFLFIGGTIEDDDSNHNAFLFLYSFTSNDSQFTCQLKWRKKGQWKYLYDADFSSDGNILVIGGLEDTNVGLANVYKFSNSQWTLIDNLELPTGKITNAVNAVKFSSDGKFLAVGGGNKTNNTTSNSSLYSVDGTTFTYIGEFTDENGEPLNGMVAADFSTSNNLVVVSPYFSNKLYLYTITSNSISLKQTIQLDEGTINDIAFDPFDRVLLVGYEGSSCGYYFYTLQNNMLVKLLNNFIDNDGLEYGRFNPNGNILVEGSNNSSPAMYVCLYKRKEQNIVSLGNIVVSNSSGFITISYKDSSDIICEFCISESTIRRSDNYELLVAISKNEIKIYLNNQPIKVDAVYDIDTIDSIVLTGKQECEYVYIEKGTIDNIPYNYTPKWDSDTIFLTNFNKASLQASPLTSVKSVLDIYRENVSNGSFEKIYSCNDDENSIRDFSWIKGNQYNYYGYLRLDKKYTSSNLFNESVVCRNQPYYLLLATEQDEEQSNVYHVVHYWRFGNNVEAGSTSNNNNPNFLTNFTGYRLKQPVARKGKSGTLTALISNVVNGEYSDTTKQMENLYALSECNNPLFLKDMKGNLYMVTISSAITQTINNKSSYQEVKISLPWEEIGSAERASIIQIPTDQGWVDDNEKLSAVRLVVDEETGMLKVVYPDEYNYVTTFGLVKPNLHAKTIENVEEPNLELVDGAVILNKED